jgi:hypothetical protein
MNIFTTYASTTAITTTNNNNNNNNNSIQIFILCAVSTAKRPITDTAQQI